MPVTGDAFHVYDTTLRDGAQQEGLSLSVADKLTIARHLDELGVGFIEGGWPGANPKDTEFFARARTELDLQHATLAAFGATRRPGRQGRRRPAGRRAARLRRPGRDAGREGVRPARRPGAADHAGGEPGDDRATPCGTCATRASGSSSTPSTSSTATAPTRRTRSRWCATAAEAGADVVVLCDTNGGMLPPELADVVAEVLAATGARLGIHCHDDTACAVANTLAAVDAGVTHVQGTANGYGERSGNANLFSVVANLELKKGRTRPARRRRCAELTRIAHAVAEVTNVSPNQHQPYVGLSAFAHKAGLHASAVKVDPMLYQHVDPAEVGNDMRMLVSDMAGRASIELKGRELGLRPRRRPRRARPRRRPGQGPGGTRLHVRGRRRVVRAAAARRGRPGSGVRHFTVESWRAIVEQGPDGDVRSEATVKVHAGGERIVATGEGNGPVNALDQALRQALRAVLPRARRLELVDYKVRILEGSQGTGAVTRVLVETVRRRRPSGTPSACTRTSSPRPGWRWRTRSRTGCCAPGGTPGRAELGPPVAWRACASPGSPSPTRSPSASSDGEPTTTRTSPRSTGTRSGRSS